MIDHIVKNIMQKLYEEKLKDIQEKYDDNNKHYIGNILLCFLLYFHSFLDLLCGLRDGHFINMSQDDRSKQMKGSGEYISFFLF